MKLNLNKMRRVVEIPLNLVFFQLCSSQEFPIMSFPMLVSKDAFMDFFSGCQLFSMSMRDQFLIKKAIFQQCLTLEQL